MEWKKGKELKTGDVLSALSIIYQLFYQVNLVFYFAIMNLKSFAAVI